MMKGLMGRYLSHKIKVDCVRVKAEATEEELAELKAWKTVQEKKLALSGQVRGELKKQTKVLKKVFKDKEKEIVDVKEHLRQVKEDTIREYHNSDALLAELGSSFADGFDDCFHQVKASFPELDLSYISIDAKAQTPTQLVYSESIDKLFADDAVIGPQGDGETALPKDRAKPVGDEARSLKGVQTTELKDRENPMDQDYIFLFFFLFVHY